MRCFISTLSIRYHVIGGCFDNFVNVLFSSFGICVTCFYKKKIMFIYYYPQEQWMYYRCEVRLDKGNSSTALGSIDFVGR